MLSPNLASILGYLYSLRMFPYFLVRTLDSFCWFLKNVKSWSKLGIQQACQILGGPTYMHVRIQPRLHCIISKLWRSDQRKDNFAIPNSERFCSHELSTLQPGSSVFIKLHGKLSLQPNREVNSIIHHMKFLCMPFRTAIKEAKDWCPGCIEHHRPSDNYWVDGWKLLVWGQNSQLFQYLFQFSKIMAVKQQQVFDSSIKLLN